jgi:hypothetical protein
MKAKFNEMYETLQSGNVSDFRKWIKGLTKADLLRFCCHCATFDLLDIFQIEQHYNS